MRLADRCGFGSRQAASEKSEVSSCRTEGRVRWNLCAWAGSISFQISFGIYDQAVRAWTDIGDEVANFWYVFGIKVWFYNKDFVEVRAVFQAKYRVAYKLMKYLKQ